MKRTCGVQLGALALASVGRAAPEAHHDWSYSGATGPSRWASLDTSYATCRIGKMQSPINIEPAKARREQLPSLVFDYRPAALHIIDNGHTIQVNVRAGSVLTVGGHRYELVQFHLHHPSEETIDGKPSEMVAHLVHRDAEGQVAVVAVLLQSGAQNPLLSSLWQNLPRKKEHEFTPAGVMIDVSKLLPAAYGYYTYPGSLMTPPCSEGVRWFVLKSPVTLSTDQIATFAKLYPANARSTQPLNGRVVLSSE